MKFLSRILVMIAVGAVGLPASGQEKDNARVNDMAAQWKAPQTGFDYVKRVEMIPMRDGVKLYTVIVVPNGAKNAPMILTRTPYNAAGRTQRPRSGDSPYMVDELPQGDEVFVRAGYIRVFQDVRGKYGSEGNYLMVPPPMGPLNTTGTDDTTDGYDTIDWLVKNVPESNGRVGMLGSSYEGFTVVMALIHPHAALKVAAPESPMVDGWMGDDWFHYGAFRQNNLDYFTLQTTKRGEGKAIPRDELRRLHELSGDRVGGRFRAIWRVRAAGVLEVDGGASGVRRVLAGAGAGQNHGEDAADGAGDVGAGTLGPGRYVGRDSRVGGDGAEGHVERQKFSGDGAVAA